MVTSDVHGAAFDPLAAIRRDDDPPVDVFLTGTVFFDIIFIDLNEPPHSGAEVHAGGMGASPGGVANLAVACARLGLRTSVAATFGEDFYGDYCRQTMGVQEGVDLTYARYITGSHSPVTVSMVYESDRAMVTHAHRSDAIHQLIGEPPRAKACSTDLDHERPPWVDTIAASGGLVFADVGWDPEDKWNPEHLRAKLDGCDVFTPNAVEAIHYTSTSSPDAALKMLADLVPLTVITCGSDGLIANDRESGQTLRVPGLPVRAFDPTGAGDVLQAALMVGTLAKWPLEHSLRLANLCAALSVQHFGGALAAPGWHDIAAWWRGAASADPQVAHAYGFLGDVLPHRSLPQVSRAIATLGFRARPPR